MKYYLGNMILKNEIGVAYKKSCPHIAPSNYLSRNSPRLTFDSNSKPLSIVFNTFQIIP